MAFELCLAAPLVAATARTATENFVTNKIAAAISQIPPPDFSTNNAALVETIEATAPAPGNYAAVSNAAVHAAITNALQDAALTNMHNWVVGKLSEYRDKLDLNVYGRGNAFVSFPAGYSITYGGDTYSTETGTGIEFYGPISSTAVPQYNFWVPYEYKDATDFDPQAQTVWCLFVAIGNSAPDSMMYRTGALYTIANWDTKAPTLTLAYGEASGGEPTMTRPLGVTGDTLAKASQLDGKQDNLPYPTNAIPYAAISGKPSLATIATSGSYNDLSNKPTIPTVPTAQINAATATNALQDAELESHASQLSQLSQTLDGKVPTSRTVNGKALTSNISLSADEVGATTPEDVTAAIREQSLGGIWDETLQVWWTPRMRNGSLTYEATTNVNLNAEN